MTAKHWIVEQRCCLDLYSKITFTKFPVVVVVVVVFCTVKSTFLNPPNTTVYSASAIYCMQAALTICCSGLLLTGLSL